MLGEIKGRKGHALLLNHRGYGSFEANDGTTYTVQALDVGFKVEELVWDNAAEDWKGLAVDLPWEVFAARHHIHSVVFVSMKRSQVRV